MKPAPFNAVKNLEVNGRSYAYYDLAALEHAGLCNISKLPFSIRVLLENALRNAHIGPATEDDVRLVAGWSPEQAPPKEFPYMPGRVTLQDFTGVPVVVDLAAMRDAVAAKGADASIINPSVHSDLVIDHSVQVDYFASEGALARNIDLEFERNVERYKLLKWSQSAFDNMLVVPPGTGIVHQVNLEFLASTVLTTEVEGETFAFPDTCVGTDSHTTMINGLGVLGWGVGGIEAEAVMLGQPYYMLVPEVVGVKLSGSLPDGATATDLVLAITEVLRNVGVVEKFVEFYGPGLATLPVADRATIGNMAPEYGATCGFFPVDDQTIDYLRRTGRSEETVTLVEAYAKANFLTPSESDDPQYTTSIEFDLADVEPSMAGPKRPQDRVTLSNVAGNFRDAFPDASANGADVTDGSVVIAAITSCTNTSNPSVMVGAGLLARNAVERGLERKWWVKSSLAPGSKVVTDYLDRAGLTDPLEALGFQTVGYGCTTCIGNSGPLPQEVADTVTDHDLVAAAVLSGNRNFEGRVHPQVKANYLASPMLVVAYALAGRIDVDLNRDALGIDEDGNEVYLSDIWPSQIEIAQTVASAVGVDQFNNRYGAVYEGPEQWQELETATGELFQWETGSTYIQPPPYFEGFELEPEPREGVEKARVLVSVGDSVTTDHISPAGSIPQSAPSGQHLIANDVPRRAFNSYGSRRGNHNVMMRGTFGNIRLRNQLTPEYEGDWTVYHPTGETMRIFNAAERYRADGVPLIVLAGKEYGTGSSRDWAAKGPMLLGVRAVIAESFERIHRSNLVGMGVVPLQFTNGQSARSLGLDGTETYTIEGVEGTVQPGANLSVTATASDGSITSFEVLSRVDTAIEAEYYEHGGLLPYVLRQMIAQG
ncbi:MAG: aconitate hydratase AcnA [Chloroflexi bacterium]|nr:aconitate hydratase AcnA [Chloroflexota bacterium]